MLLQLFFLIFQLYKNCHAKKRRYFLKIKTLTQIVPSNGVQIAGYFLIFVAFLHSLVAE